MQLLFSESPFVDQFLQDVPLRDTLIMQQETNGYPECPDLFLVKPNGYEE